MTIKLSRFFVGAMLAVLCWAQWSVAAETVLHYHFTNEDMPKILDLGPAMNDATAAEAAVLSFDIPVEGVPPDAGDFSLDSTAAANPGDPLPDPPLPFSGAVTDNTLLLDNASIAAAGGFTMECWFKWYGGGDVNSIIDYAGTEKIVIADPGAGLVEMLIAGTGRIPIGFVNPFEWHYVAVIFDTDGEPQNADGTIDGTTRVYLDGLAPTNIVAGMKNNFGDGLIRPIGIGMHPLGFPRDFFDGLIFEPRVSLGTVALEDLLLEGADVPSGTGEVFQYSLASDTALPAIPDVRGPGNDATAGAAAALSSDTPRSAPDNAGDRSLDTSGGAGAVTDDTLLLSNQAIAAAGGFLMECWFNWNGGGVVNSIIDYAGTERIIIDTASPVPGQVELEIGATLIPLGVATPGEWHYVAVIFSSGGKPVGVGGNLSGVVKVYFDQLVQPAGFFAATKDTAGDDLNAGVGVGQNPLGGDVFDGLIFEPRVRLGVVGVELLRYTIPQAEAGTLFKFSFFEEKTVLPDIEDLGPLGYDAVAGPGAVLVPGDIPFEGVPAGAGDSSLDCSAFNNGGEASGAVVSDTLLLSNAAVAQAGGFTMEAWIKYKGAGTVNSIIDYAGTEKMTIRGGMVTMQFDGPRRDYPIGPAITGEWHYAAAVFDTGGAPLNADGTITGTVTTYFDSLAPSGVVADVVKGNFGDSLVRGIGIGQHPLGFGGDFLDGFLFEPKVSLGALSPEDLQLDAVIVQPTELAFHYSFSDATALPAIVDQSPAGNDATAAGGASLDADVPAATPAGSGNRSLDTAGGGAVTDVTGLLDNDTLTSFSGFTMETWFKWNGGGGAQSIMDYAGTDRIVVRGGTVNLLMDGVADIPIGAATSGAWHYVAAVFNTNGKPANGDGTVTGTVTVYFDGVDPISVVDDVTKSNVGDGLNLGVGVGQNPAGGDVLSGKIFEPRLALGPLGRRDLAYVIPALPAATVFRYSIFEEDALLLPAILDVGPAENDATAGDGAVLSLDTPVDGVPQDAGEMSLDSSGDSTLAPTGAVTDNIDLLTNELVAAHGGFTMECWFVWNGEGTVNSIIDYAGTEKLVIDRRGIIPPAPLVELLVSDGASRVGVADATVGQWHYIAVVFATGGRPLHADGSITGSVTVYFDGTEPIATTENITKSAFGDSLDRGIGIGMHPLGFAADFFDGSIFEPRVTLGPLAPEQLLYGGVIDVERFVRGDVNSDGSINLTDGVVILNFLFLGGESPACMDAADVDDTGGDLPTLTDAVRIFNWLFTGGPAPGEPTPSVATYIPEDCGTDSTDDEMDCAASSAKCSP